MSIEWPCSVNPMNWPHEWLMSAKRSGRGSPVGSGGSMRITPYDPAFENQMKAAREGMAQYRNALRELAR